MALSRPQDCISCMVNKWVKREQDDSNTGDDCAHNKTKQYTKMNFIANKS